MAGTLVKKAGIYFVGNLASRALMAIIIPVYAFFVTPSAVGSYDYWLSLAQTATPIVFLAIWEAVLKFLITSNDRQYNNIATGTVVVFALVMYLISIFSTALATIASQIDCSMMASILLMCGAMGFLQIWQYFARAAGRTREFAFSGVLASVVTFVLILTLVCILSLQEIGLVASYVGGQIAGWLYLEWNVRLISAETVLNASRHLLGKMLRYSAPCVFNLITATLMLSVGRIIAVNCIGSEANGLYAFALKFANIVTAVGGIFSMAVIEEGILRAGSSALGAFYTRVSTSLFSLLLAIASIGMPAIALLYDIMGATEYASSINLIPLSIIYAVSNVMATQFGSVFMALGKTSNQAVTTTVGLCVTVVVSLLMVDSFQLQGVMGGLASGTLAMAVLRYILARRMLEFRVGLKRASSLLCLFLLCVAYLYLTDFGATALGHLACFLFTGGIAAPFLFRSMKELYRVSDSENAEQACNVKGGE